MGYQYSVFPDPANGPYDYRLLYRCHLCGHEF